MDVKDWLEINRRNGYVQELRRHIGHAPLIGVACGVIVVNSDGEIFLQKRRDNGCWGIIGGTMEIGESAIAAANDNARIFFITSSSSSINTNEIWLSPV